MFKGQCRTKLASIISLNTTQFASQAGKGTMSEASDYGMEILGDNFYIMFLQYNEYEIGQN